MQYCILDGYIILVIETYLEVYGNYVEEAHPIIFIGVGMEYEEYNKKHLLEYEEHDKEQLEYSYHEVVHT